MGDTATSQERLEPRGRERREAASLEPDPRTLAVSLLICCGP